jgi:acylphosphatase
MEARLHVIVEGIVQGVGFRWFVERRAQARSLRGYVRNRYDGSVEVEAEGEKEALEEFLVELRAGPRSAQVTETVVTWLPAVGGTAGFYIKD